MDFHLTYFQYHQFQHCHLLVHYWYHLIQTPENSFYLKLLSCWYQFYLNVYHSHHFRNCRLTSSVTHFTPSHATLKKWKLQSTFTCTSSLVSSLSISIFMWKVINLTWKSWISCVEKLTLGIQVNHTFDLYFWKFLFLLVDLGIFLFIVHSSLRT